MNEIVRAQASAPASSYRDAARYESERRLVFGRSWLFMGHVSELAREGDVVAATIAGFPLLAVRAKDGLKAFHNVCRHRAGPLFDEDRGHCGTALTSKYHGWVYTLDGRVRNARDFGAAAGFDPREYGLFELKVETWRGFVFVNADAGAPALPLEPLETKLGARSFEHLVHAARRTHDIACNWKIYVENYLEGYHIPLVHPGLNDQVDALNYGVTVEGNVCFHTAPPKIPGETVYDGLWAFALPNLGFNSYGDDGLMMERMVPMGLNSTRLIYDFYLTPDVAADAQEKQRILSTSGIVVAEDKWICERVQANIDAGIYSAGVLSPKHEAGVAWFQRFVAKF